MKKSASILFILLLFFSYTVQALSIDTSLRTAYYNTGIKACIYHYDSIIIATTELRKKNLMTEEAFLEQYAFQQKQYKNQHEIILFWAEEWSKNNYALSKNIKASLSLLANDNAHDAFLLIERKLVGKKITKKNNADFVFKAQLASFLAYEPQAIESYKIIAESEYATLQNLLQYAHNLSFFGKDEMATKWFRRAEKQCQTDTLCLLANKYEWSKMQAYRNDSNAAAATLIEAQYLINKFSKNSDSKQQLQSKILSDLANLQLAQGNFDNAFANAKASVTAAAQLPQNEGLPILTAAKHYLALVYKKAGGNEQADTLFNELDKLYPKLVANYSQKYLPNYTSMLADYAAIHRWFNRLDDLEKTSKRLHDLQKKLMHNNFPFFLLTFAEQQKFWAQKTMDLDLKVFIAEEKWQEGRDALLRINQRNVMLYGQTLCSILDKLGSVQIALKKPAESAPIFNQLLTLRQKLYAIAPTENKIELMNTYVQNGTVNAIIQKKDLSLSQLDKAIQLATELGENAKAKELTRFRTDVATH